MSFDRRTFLLSAVATSATIVPAAAAAAPRTRLTDVLDRIAKDSLSRSPEALSELGTDVGAQAWARGAWNDRSPAARARAIADAVTYKRMLDSIPVSALRGRDRLIRDTVAYALSSGMAGAAFPFGTVGTFGGGSPYVISPRDGLYQQAPEFLDTIHPIESAADADAYLSRLSRMGEGLNQETTRLIGDAALGVLPPDFLVDITLKQLADLREPAAESSQLAQSLARRAAARRIPGRWRERAAKIVASSIYPALERQHATLASLRVKATSDAGVWKLRDGDAYYSWLLRYRTTTDLTPEEIHKLGLEQGKALDARIDALLKMQGLTQGEIGDRLSALGRERRETFPNDEHGRAATLNYVRENVAALRQLLPRVSKMHLRADVLVKRVPQAIEEGAALGYTNGPSRDGKRPSIFYINLHDTASWPRFAIPTLAAHEAIPGHCWQDAYAATETAAPLISSLMYFDAYVEGWALYAEQLVDELGFYDDNPLGKIGMLQAARQRVSRLVTDTGIHARRWSRERATNYMASTTGRSRTACVHEVDRYCATPGQACSYRVGQIEILRLRERAKMRLGNRFDVRDFNDAVVRTGSVPLTVLADAVDAYINEISVHAAH